MKVLQTPENLRLMQELIDKNYGNVGGVGSVTAPLAKIDAPMLTTTDTNGLFNTQFGAALFRQLNESNVLFGALPQYAYRRNGFRAQTTRYLNSGAGVTQNASIPESIKPTTVAVTVGLSEMSIAAEYSERLRLLAQKSEDDAADLQGLLDAAKGSYMYAIDADMNSAVDAGTAGYNIESIDRVVSSYSEINACSVTSNYGDIYGLDRDAGATWADAYVNHNSGTTREIDMSIVTDLISGTKRAGADPKSQFWYTGDDTWNQLQGLAQNQIRYNTPEEFKAMGEGVEQGGKAGGFNFGAEMGTLFGKPVYVAPYGKVAATGSASPLSNLYLLSTQNDPRYNEPTLGVKVLQAPMLAETRLQTYPAHGKLGNKFVIYSAMQLECKRFNIQGKARDLKAAI